MMQTVAELVLIVYCIKNDKSINIIYGSAGVIKLESVPGGSFRKSRSIDSLQGTCHESRFSQILLHLALLPNYRFRN
jgi:hypothetical protein